MNIEKRRATGRCPVCRCRRHDGYPYEADEEQRGLGYPPLFRLCASCYTPMVEMGQYGQCQPFRPGKFVPGLGPDLGARSYETAGR